MATNYIQKLLLLKYGILTRGAIAIGKLAYDDDFLYGPLMVLLNDLEKKAKYPRILVHESVINLIDECEPCYEFPAHCKVSRFFFKDLSDQLCLNYLGFNMPSVLPEDSHMVCPTMSDISEHRRVITELMKTHYDRKPDMNIEDWKNIRDKYVWVIQYHNDFCLLHDIKDYIIDTEVYDSTHNN